MLDVKRPHAKLLTRAVKGYWHAAESSYFNQGNAVAKPQSPLSEHTHTLSQGPRQLVRVSLGMVPKLPIYPLPLHRTSLILCVPLLINIKILQRNITALEKGVGKSRPNLIENII